MTPHEWLAQLQRQWRENAATALRAKDTAATKRGFERECARETYRRCRVRADELRELIERAESAVEAQDATESGGEVERE